MSTSTVGPSVSSRRKARAHSSAVKSAMTVPRTSACRAPWDLALLRAGLGSRSTRAGAPPAITSSGREALTMLPAVTTVPRPMRTPFVTRTRAASHTSSPMSMALEPRLVGDDDLRSDAYPRTDPYAFVRGYSCAEVDVDAITDVEHGSVCSVELHRVEGAVHLEVVAELDRPTVFDHGFAARSRTRPDHVALARSGGPTRKAPRRWRHALFTRRRSGEAPPEVHARRARSSQRGRAGHVCARSWRITIHANFGSRSR